MTKKQLATLEGLSVSRIGQLITSLELDIGIDFYLVDMARRKQRIEFTESGIEKIKNRNKIRHRPKIIS